MAPYARLSARRTTVRSRCRRGGPRGERRPAASAGLSRGAAPRLSPADAAGLLSPLGPPRRQRLRTVVRRAESRAYGAIGQAGGTRSPCGGGVGQSGDPYRSAARDPRPVSYTHLTLPTKRVV